jgi:hypothetical protein
MGGIEVYMQILSFLALDKGNLSASRPGHFTLMERAPDTYWIVDWAVLTRSRDPVDQRIISLTL